MSRDMLGPIVRALVGVPQQHHGVILDIVNKLGGDHADGVRKRVAQALREPAVAEAVTETPKPPVLRLVDNNVELGAVPAHDPHAYYKTRTGLWISDEVVRLILSKAKPVQNLGPVSLSSYELKQNAYDREITPELPASTYVFDESELCARLEQMIAKQPNGKAGDLLTNGYANIFYVAVCVVFVDWRAAYRGWRVGAWGLDGGRWNAGRHVFSRN